MKDSAPTRKCLSLQDLCVRNAIDHLDHIGDVGHTDEDMLRIILPHCNAEQLLRIEECTKGRDLRRITDDLWLKCYMREFGELNAKTVMKRLKENSKSFKWKDLYKAKLGEQDEVQKKGVNRLKELYKEAGVQKAGRKLQQIDLMPPGSKKRQFGSGGGTSVARFPKASTSVSGSSNGRGRLMKKSRIEYSASLEVHKTGAARKKPVVPSVKSAGLVHRR